MMETCKNSKHKKVAVMYEVIVMTDYGKGHGCIKGNSCLQMA